MGLPINPNPSGPIPLIIPPVPGPGGLTPLQQQALIDTFAPSLSSTLPAPPVDASQPTLASFFGSVGSAELKELIQNYANASADPLVMQKLLQEAVTQAGSTAGVIAEIVQYHELLTELNNLNLPGAESTLNGAIDSFNSNAGQDTTEINAMNAAIGQYNTAQSDYQSALTTYQGDLTIFATAQSTYNTALNTWNTAVSNYNAGTITAGQLQADQNTFNIAKSQFNTAQTTLSGQQTTFGTAETAWTNAQSNLTNQSSAYNGYVQGQDSGLSSATQAYNTAIGNALPLLSQMNGIQQFFFGAGVSLPTPTAYTSSGMPIFDQGTPGPDNLRNQVEGTLDGDNTTTANMNTTIGDITDTINAINSGGYNPPLTAPPPLTPLATLPSANSNYSLSPLTFSPPGDVTFDFASLTQFDTAFLTVMLDATDQINTINTQQTTFRKQVVDPANNFVVNNAPTTTVGLGSSVSVSAHQAHVIGAVENPHLLRTLSKNVFESAIGAYGVQAGSPFVDEFEALVFGYKRTLGFTSIGPAKGILGDNPVEGATGQAAAETAVSLGFASQVKALISSDQITADVTKLVNQNATLDALTPEAKTALIQTLVQEIGATLIKSSLNQLATSLNLPGLVSQILANLSPPQANLQQVNSELAIAQELSKELNISTAAADAIVQAAVKQASQQNAVLTANAISQAILSQITQQGVLGATITAQAAQSSAVADADQEETTNEDDQQSDEIAADNLKSDNLKAAVLKSVIAADAANRSNIQASQIQSDEAKRDAFTDSLAKSLQAQQIEPTHIKKLLDIYRPTILNALISGLIKPSYFEALTNNLIKLHLTPHEARDIAQTAVSKANEKDIALNPLSTFMGSQVAGLPQISAIFKKQAADQLTPVVGQRHALDVAEESAGTVNSFIQALQANNTHTAKVTDDYRNAQQAFINPLDDPAGPLLNGNTLILSGTAAGISSQGTTSADNTAGPLGFHNKKPIDMPG